MIILGGVAGGEHGQSISGGAVDGAEVEVDGPGPTVAADIQKQELCPGPWLRRWFDLPVIGFRGDDEAV